MRNLFLLAVFLLPVHLFAQQPVAVGDTVPDILFENVLNYSRPKASLSDFKENLILIDFWSTWCTSCAHAFPKMDSLQSTFVGDLKVLLVNSRSTGDDLSKVQTYLKKWKDRTGKALNLTIAAGDTVAANLFPHQIIPHYAWIYKGRLVALTSSHEVTTSAIRNILENHSMSLSVKKDLDAERPLFSVPSLPSGQLLNYSILLKGWYNGLPGGSRKRMKDGIVYGRAFTNRPLLELYKTAAMQIDSGLNERLIVIDSRDSLALVPTPEETGSEQWYIDHAYTIDLIVPVDQPDQLYTRMLEVLNAYSGYRGFFEERSILCWVLRLKEKSKLQSMGGATQNNLGGLQPSLKNGTISMLVRYLNSVPATRYYVLNETGYNGKLDISFADGGREIHGICQTLEAYGLDLHLEERKRKVFVLTKQ